MYLPIHERDVPVSLIAVDVAERRIVAIHVVREPSKLAAALTGLPAACVRPVPIGPPSARR